MHPPVLFVQGVFISILGLDCTFLLLMLFLLETPEFLSLSGDFGRVLQESCAKEVQKPQEFPTHRNFKKTQIICESVGK